MEEEIKKELSTTEVEENNAPRIFTWKEALSNFDSNIDRNLFSHLPETKETSFERIERKIDLLSREVATKDDLIKHTNILLKNQKKQNEELLEKLQTLRLLQKNNVAHKRLSRYSLMFLVFFSLSFLLKLIFNITIVTTFWNNLGLVLSFGFLLMALAMGKDWRRNLSKGEKHDRNNLE